MNIQFLTDENIPTSLVKALRKKGYNVKDIKEEKLYGIDDNKVVEIAKKEDRVILTHDKDFYNLSQFPQQSHRGIILIRYKNQSPQNVIFRFIPLIESELKDKIKNSLIIVAEDYIKVRD